ncbi:MAG: hypothetical protein B6I24_05945 [Bacteroidetes bacterium 4572_128]|nr:MAG: hypothetical protein B6I24_05945 [Bacteroidetes bacterium 4572_128]
MEKLNEHQEKAVTYNKGSLLVLAGPGSGKTKILTHRIAHILNDSLNERYKILALTFTNKASDEMKNRIKKLVYDTKSISRLSIGTFHGFAYKTLKSYGSYIGISSDFIIYDKKEDLYQILFDAIVKYIRNEQEDDTKRHILLRNEAFQNIALLENNIVNIFNIIEKIKHQIFKNEEFKKSYLYSEEIEIILEIYEKELKEYKILDYSDLLLKTIELFDKKDFLRKDYQKIYKHILVDEGQDTNKLQFELLKLLANNENNLFIVADEDQVIYEWNDAHFKYLLELRKRYKAEIIQLYETYRCPEQIIEIANKLIAHNKIRLTEKHKLKTLKRDQKENILVLLYQEIEKF